MRQLNLIRVCVLCVVYVVWASVGLAGTLTLAWDPSPGAIGYVVSYGAESGAYSATIDVGYTHSQQIAGLADGIIYYFTVRAYGESGVSEPSAEISGESVATTVGPRLASPASRTP